MSVVSSPMVTRERARGIDCASSRLGVNGDVPLESEREMMHVSLHSSGTAMSRLRARERGRAYP